MAAFNTEKWSRQLMSADIPLLLTSVFYFNPDCQETELCIHIYMSL